MPSYTFTANAGTDEITTSSPHGLTTGDGPGALRNVGGALPAATPSLAALTDYWFIVTGASTLKIATSSSNALSNIFVDITGAGTGTHYLEIGVPYRRPRTYAVGSQLKSADLNANFDAWIALHSLLTGQSQSVWNGVTLAGALSVGGTLGATGLITASGGLTCAANQHVTLSGTGALKHGDKTFSIDWAGGQATTGTFSFGVFVPGPPDAYAWATSGAGVVVIAIKGLRAGDRVKKILLRGTSPNDGTVTITRQNYDVATNHAFSSTGQFNSTGYKECTLSSPPTLVDDEVIWVKVAAGAGAITFTHITVTYDRP